MTTTAEIRTWLNEAKAAGATHVIVLQDTFDGSDYPVMVHEGQKIADKLKEYDGERNMQRVEEVYDLAIDLECQLAQDRAYNL